MNYPIWIRLSYTMFYRSKKPVGYTKSINSEQDFIDFINRISLEKSMITEIYVNDQKYPIDKLDGVFNKALAQREEAV